MKIILEPKSVLFMHEATGYADALRRLLDRIREKNPVATEMTVVISDSCSHDFEFTDIILSGKYQAKCSRCQELIYISKGKR